MLSPQTLQQLPDELAELVNEVHTEIICSIAKKLVKADYLTPSAEWQLYKASQLRMSTKEVTAMLAELTGKSKRQISKLYTKACMEAINNDAKIYRAYGKDCSAALRSVALSNTLKAGIKNANGMTRNLCRSMVESSVGTVTHLMDKAWLKVHSGAFSPQEAIYDAVSELADMGIQSVTYPSGRTDWADVAVRRAVMTGISQTAGQMQLDLAAEMDCDLVEVTAHMGARPSHAEWQGKVYSISGKSKKYPKLSTATGYGTGAGLKGWNCRHDFYPFFEGISERANLPVDISENNEQYALSQKQRAMERSIRASKRRLSALDGAMQAADDDVPKRQFQTQFERHSAILKTKEKRLSEFCDKNSLYPEKDRVRVVGFGKSVSQKAVHGNKRYVKQQDVGLGTSRDTASKKKIPSNTKIIDMVVDKSGESSIIKIEKKSSSDVIQWLPKGKKISDNDFKNIRDYANSKGIKLESFKNSDIDVELAKEIINSASGVLEIFPELRGEGRKTFTLSISETMSANDFAMTNMEITHIVYLNSNAFRNAKKLSEEYNKLVEKKWFVQGTTYNSIVKHELGHLYQAVHNISNAKIIEIAMQASSTFDENTLFKFLNDNLSEYSGTLMDGSEIISEVFSDYFGNNNPTEFSKNFIRELIRLR